MQKMRLRRKLIRMALIQEHKKCLWGCFWFSKMMWGVGVKPLVHTQFGGKNMGSDRGQFLKYASPNEVWSFKTSFRLFQAYWSLSKLVKARRIYWPPKARSRYTCKFFTEIPRASIVVVFEAPPHSWPAIINQLRQNCCSKGVMTG